MIAVMEISNPLFCVRVMQDEKIIRSNKDGVTNLANMAPFKRIQCLKEASNIEYNNNGCLKRITVSEEVLTCLDEWLKELLNKFKNSNTESLEVIIEILRLLRNCTTNLSTQQYIIEKTNILSSVDFLFLEFTVNYKKHICLKVLLQFLINLISSNVNAAEKIFIMFYERIRNCLQSNINIYESSALIYYISLSKHICNAELINIALELYRNNLENEFLIFFLENSISQADLWNIYEDIRTENKITLLEILKNMHLQNQTYNLPSISLKVFIENFLKSAGKVFNMTDGEENKLRASEISLLLEILSFLSSNEDYLKYLQSDNNILINAGVLLINIHKLGKESDNCFTPIQKLTEFKVNSNLNEHPAFGFKADLIRLIGNLCWKNRKMQNLARTAALIPVILDCCNMDARNPFIIQWSVLAVRNFCENNVENQKIIANLHQEGTVSSETLNEMGMTLHSDGEGELKIVHLDSLKKH